MNGPAPLPPQGPLILEALRLVEGAASLEAGLAAAPGAELKALLAASEAGTLLLQLEGGRSLRAAGNLPFPAGTALTFRIQPQPDGTIQLQPLRAEPPPPPPLLAPLLLGEAASLLQRLAAPDAPPALRPLQTLLAQAQAPSPAPAPSPAQVQASTQSAAPALAFLRAAVAPPAPGAEPPPPALPPPAGALAAALAPRLEARGLPREAAVPLAALLLGEPPASAPAPAPPSSTPPSSAPPSAATSQAAPTAPQPSLSPPAPAPAPAPVPAPGLPAPPTTPAPEFPSASLGQPPTAPPPSAPGAAAPTSTPASAPPPAPPLGAASGTPLPAEAPQDPHSPTLDLPEAWLRALGLPLPARGVGPRPGPGGGGLGPEPEAVEGLRRLLERLPPPLAHRALILTALLPPGPALPRQDPLAQLIRALLPALEGALREAALRPDSLRPPEARGPGSPAEPASWAQWMKEVVRALSRPEASPAEAPFHRLQAREGTALFEVPLPWSPGAGTLELWAERDAPEAGREETHRVLLALELGALGPLRASLQSGPGGIQAQVVASPEAAARLEPLLREELGEPPPFPCRVRAGAPLPPPPRTLAGGGLQALG